VPFHVRVLLPDECLPELDRRRGKVSRTRYLRWLLRAELGARSPLSPRPARSGREPKARPERLLDRAGQECDHPAARRLVDAVCGACGQVVSA